jgi:hypothetical protein
MLGKGFIRLTKKDDVFTADAIRKQIAEKPSFEGDSCDEYGEIIYDTWLCPNCDKPYEYDYEMYDYCPCCGQKINWEGVL